jgi:hypothetical protein
VRIQAGNSKGFGGYSGDASVTVSGIQSVIGSWKMDYTNSTETYRFEENGKLTNTYTNNNGSTRLSYYFYDPAKKEWYEGAPTGYTLSGNSLTISLNRQYSLTSEDHQGLIGTWKEENGETQVEITADTITVGSDTYPYYTYTDSYNGSEQTLLRYKQADAEPEGRYALSGGKLQLTQIYRTPYARQGTGSGLVGTWKDTWDNGEIWTFNSDGTAEYKRIEDGKERNKQTYPSYTASNGKITLEQVLGTLSGNTLTFMDIPFTREGSFSDIIGTWKGSFPSDGEETIPITLKITSDKLDFIAQQTGESESVPIWIEGNSLYTTIEYGYKLENSNNTLILISEYTDEYERVSS